MENQQVCCSHILLKHTKSRNPNDSVRKKTITRTYEEAMEIILKIQKKLINSSNLLVDFEEIAYETSECGSSLEKGSLGFFSRNQMQKEFEDVSFNLQIGQLSEPVSTASGIHLILRTA